MKTFLGIGASHMRDIYDFAYDTLSQYAPQAITLEQRMRFCEIGEISSVARSREKRFESNQCKIRFEKGRSAVVRWDHLNGMEVRKVKLFLDEWCVLDGSIFENNPALAYALDNDIPFYFVDVPLLDKSIIEFRKDGYRIIDLEEHGELTRDIPTRGMPFRRDNIARNKFAADAINYIFMTHDTVAHVGGTGHFNEQYLLTDRWEPFAQDVQTHIQDLVKADKVFIADSNTETIHQLRSLKLKIQNPQETSFTSSL